MPITRRRRANQPDQPENNNHLADQTEQAAASLAAEQASSTPMEGDQRVPPTQDRLDNATPTAPTTPSMTNGDRTERPEYTPAPTIEGGRRTPRGELFRRPPQPPAPPPAAFAPSPSVQAIPPPLQNWSSGTVIRRLPMQPPMFGIGTRRRTSFRRRSCGHL